MLCRTTKACRKILLDFLPLILATTPTPQASCSNQGSYNPCFFGQRSIHNKFPSQSILSVNLLAVLLVFLLKTTSTTVILIIILRYYYCKLYTCIFTCITKVLQKAIFWKKHFYTPYTPLHFSDTFFHFSYTLNVFLGIFLFSHLTNREIVAIMWRTQRCVYFNFKNKNAMTGKIYLPQHPERRHMVQAASKQAKKLTREQLLWTK